MLLILLIGLGFIVLMSIKERIDMHIQRVEYEQKQQNKNNTKTK